MSVKDIIKIGRSSSSDYRIQSESVSNDHAMLIISQNNEYFLIDCNSTNGTRILNQNRGKMINQSNVSIDEIIFFGDHECRVKDVLSSRKPHAAIKEGDFTLVRDLDNGTIKKKLKNET